MLSFAHLQSCREKTQLQASDYLDRQMLADGSVPNARCENGSDAWGNGSIFSRGSTFIVSNGNRAICSMIPALEPAIT